MSKPSSGTISGIELNDKNIPVRFVWRDNPCQVKEIQECWRLTGHWWDGQGERTFFRVLTESGSIYELCFDCATSAWTISRIED